MEGIFAGAIMALLFFVLLLIPILILYLIALWKVFQKAGHEGWEAIIPFYNTWVLTEISGTAWWYALIIILSNFGVLSDTGFEWILNLAAIVAHFFICYNLSKKFHKDTGFAILLTIFPLVMIPILAFSKDCQYDANVVVSENGPIMTNKENTYQAGTSSNVNNSDKRFCQYCGKEINVNAKFCGNCGNEIKYL